MSTENIDVKEYNQQGRTLFSADKYEEAIAVYNKALKIDQKDVQTYFNLVESYIMLDKYDEARAAVQKVLLLDKKNGEAYFHLGNIDFLTEDIEKGRENYAMAFNCGFDDAQMYINLASFSEDDDDYAEALKYYNKAIARDPRNVPARVRKIEILISMNAPAEALQTSEKLVEKNPEIFEGHHYKFVALVSMNKYDEAEKCLLFAEKMFPDDQGFIFDRIKLLELRGKFEEALQLLESRITTAPKEIEVNERAKLLLALDRLDEAESVLKNQVSVEPNGELLYLLILIGLEKKDYSGISNYSDSIIALEEYNGDYFAAVYYKALALSKLGQAEEAKAAYESAGKILQSACSVNAGILELYIYRAICYKELKNFDKALEMVEYVLNLNPSLGEAYYIRSAIYEDLGDTTKAEEDKKTALQKSANLSKLLG